MADIEERARVAADEIMARQITFPDAVTIHAMMIKAYLAGAAQAQKDYIAYYGMQVE